MRNKLIIFATMMLLASCATQKKATEDTTPTVATSANAAFVNKIVGNTITSEDIVGNATVALKFGDKNISVPGAVHMRKDKVIRLQLFIPLLGTEVGRLEFTPDYVLVVDRLNKQYVKGDYNQIDFLRRNGINFHSLQALFWNQLTMPGKKSVGVGDADSFSIDASDTGTYIPVVLDKGNMKFQWSVGRNDGTITSAVITYNSTSMGTSMLTWLYSNFMQVGKKRFPGTQDATFQTYLQGKKQQGNIKITMSEVKTNSDWEAETTISSKYKKVEAEDVLLKLMSL